MSQNAPEQQSAPPRPTRREVRCAEALRENLHKRKLQQQLRAEQKPDQNTEE